MKSGCPPANHPRAYRVQLTIAAIDRTSLQNRSLHALDVAVPLLPPRGTRFTLAVPWSVFDSLRVRGRLELSRCQLGLVPNRLPEDSLLTDYPQGVRFGKDVSINPPR